MEWRATRARLKLKVVTVLGGAIDVSPHLETRNKIQKKNKTNCRQKEREREGFVYYFLLFKSFKEKSIRLLCCTTSGIDERAEREERGTFSSSSFISLFAWIYDALCTVKRPELTIQRDSSITSLFISSFLVAVFILSPRPRREENDLEPYKIIL